jgi:hypothetical protein
MTHCRLTTVAHLAHFARSVVDSDNTTYIVIAFSSGYLVASETPNGALPNCRLVVLVAKRRVFVRRVVALSLGF